MLSLWPSRFEDYNYCGKNEQPLFCYQRLLIFSAIFWIFMPLWIYNVKESILLLIFTSFKNWFHLLIWVKFIKLPVLFLSISSYHQKEPIEDLNFNLCQLLFWFFFNRGEWLLTPYLCMWHKMQPRTKPCPT